MFSKFLDVIENIYRFMFIPNEIKNSLPNTFVEKDIKLNKNGSNLPKILLKCLQEDYEKFMRLGELLQSNIDDVCKINLKIEGNIIYLIMKTKNFEDDFYLWEWSDGTVMLLSYICAIHLTKEHSILLFEEPENYIHVRLLEFLTNLMKNSSHQIILSTHSLYFLDFCEPEDLIIVEKENGETKARKIKDPEKLKYVLEYSGISLGESYHSDELKNI